MRGRGDGLEGSLFWLAYSLSQKDLTNNPQEDFLGIILRDFTISKKRLQGAIAAIVVDTTNRERKRFRVSSEFPYEGRIKEKIAEYKPSWETEITEKIYEAEWIKLSKIC